MLNLVWLNHKPIIGLAPMDGWTDSPFRQICKTQGADLVFSEMIPAPGIIHLKKIENRNQKTARGLIDSLYFTEMERPIAIQIFGKKPEEMAQACAILNQGILVGANGRSPVRPDEININFGCPAKSAVSSGHGVALMDNPDLATKIVRECVRAVEMNGRSSLPITVKMRTGWRDSSEAVPFAQKMAEAGVSAIYVHGRTFKQKYTGLADWKKIYEIAKSVNIPVVGNGDVTEENRNQKIENSSGLLAGVLIGRAARGNPWIFRRDDPMGRLSEKKSEVRIKKSEKNEFKNTIIKHAQLMYDLKGEHGIIEFRKHLLSYIHGFPGASSLRQRLVQVTNLDQIREILKEVRSQN